MEGRLDDELAILNENILVCQSCLLKLAITMPDCQCSPAENYAKGEAYPNPPTSASFVQTALLSPSEKFSSRTIWYLWCTTELSPSYTKKPASASPMANPINGIIVTHFSFGSFFATHGFSTSPFLTRLEWKYLEGSGPACKADEEPKDDAGLELNWEEKGFVGGAGDISSPNGSSLSLCGVPGCIGVVAVKPPEAPLCSMSCCVPRRGVGAQTELY